MRLPILTALVLASGCVGGLDDLDNTPPPEEPDPTAKQGPAKFRSDVHPILAVCGGAACHETTAVSAALSKFYTADAAASYTATTRTISLVGTFTNIAPILTYITPNGGHNGMSYTDDQKAKITAWLAIEAQERAGEGPSGPPPIDPKEVLRVWSGCMTLESFQAADMYLWGNIPSGVGGQACRNCHQAGLDGFMSGNGTANGQAVFFEAISKTTTFLLKYFTVDAMGKVIINTGAMTNAGATIAAHPRFNGLENAGMTALEDFYMRTQAVQAAGECGPPKLVD